MTKSIRDSASVSGSHGQEIRDGKRFAFGQNWARFLGLLNEQRIARAEASLSVMLGVTHLNGRTFLDVGSGSGLFSLAARRLGARVHSFDFDPQSVACTRELKRRFYADDPQWTVEEGSVLDRAFLDRLGVFDIVYSWGVLHHTGAMWVAIENVNHVVDAFGKVFIALYNDQGRASKYWWHIKKAYVSLPKPLRFLVMAPCFLRLWGPTTIRDLIMLRPFATWRTYASDRGMSPFRDVVDWVGGFPFEVCKPEEAFDFFRAKGYELLKMRTSAGGHACNEFVFERNPRPQEGSPD